MVRGQDSVVGKHDRSSSWVTRLQCTEGNGSGKEG